MTKGMATEAEEMKNTWQIGVQDLRMDFEEIEAWRRPDALPAPLKQAIRSSWGVFPSVPTVERASLPPSHREDSNTQEKSPPGHQSLCPNNTSPRTSTLHQTWLKTLKSNCFFRSSFPYEGPQVMSNLTLISILSPVDVAALIFRLSQGP